MKYSVVTSFSNKGFSEYGERFISTFRRHWPMDVDLYVYHEGCDDILVKSAYFQTNILRMDNLQHFLNTYSGDPLYAGRCVNQPSRWKSSEITNGYNFKYDAIKFCKKVFAIHDAANRIEYGKMFWVDADIVTFDTISTKLLDKLLPDDKQLCFLGRDRYHSECGFVGYNLDWLRTSYFIDLFYSLYATGDVFNYQEWHDSYIFDRCREKMSMNGNDISDKDHRRGHVFINSILGNYMDHLKGARKVKGKSPRSEKNQRNTHAYWAS